MIYIVGRISSSLRKYLQEKGIDYAILQDMRLEFEDLPPKSVLIDFSSKISLVQSIDRSNIVANIDSLLLAGYEQYVLPAAWLAEYLKLPGPTEQVAIAMTDKAVMRQRFQEFAPEITPPFAKLDSWHTARIFADEFNFPLILKPTNLMKSLYVTKCENMSELKQNFDSLSRKLNHITLKHHAAQPTQALIEKFLVGTMHTVAGYASESGNITLHPVIADVQTAREIGYIDSFLFSRSIPSTLDGDTQTNILRAAQTGAEALGARSTMLHIEIINTASGPKIIEIGARIGGYRARMYRNATGDDLYDTAIALSKGIPPKPFNNVVSNSAFIELFPRRTGRFSHILQEKSIHSLQSLRSYAIKKNPGQIAGPAQDGHRAAVIIELGHKEQSIVLADIAALSKVEIVVT